MLHRCLTDSALDAMLGRGRLVNRIVIIGDRCVAAWGVLRANWINLRVGIAWGLGRRKRLDRHCPDVR